MPETTTLGEIAKPKKDVLKAWMIAKVADPAAHIRYASMYGTGRRGDAAGFKLRRFRRICPDPQPAVFRRDVSEAEAAGSNLRHS
jgi:hypothetical protein